MNGVELFSLGRRLMKLGVGSIPSSTFRDVPVSVRMVLIDVFENPGSTIGQIVERTGLPQSHVSTSVARLREVDAVTTTSDPADGRRTLVSPSQSSRAKAAQRHADLPDVSDQLSTDLVDRFGPDGLNQLPEVLQAIDVLARVLCAAPLEPATSSTPTGNQSC